MLAPTGSRPPQLWSIPNVQTAFVYYHTSLLATIADVINTANGAYIMFLRYHPPSCDPLLGTPFSHLLRQTRKAGTPICLSHVLLFSISSHLPSV